MPSWDVVNGAPLQWKLAEGGLSRLVIIKLRVFVCLFAVNAKTTARVDAKCSGITKNDPESVCELKSPVSSGLGEISRHFRFVVRGRPPYLTSTSGSCVDS